VVKLLPLNVMEIPEDSVKHVLPKVSVKVVADAGEFGI
jgi:hypothetical protein